MKSNSLGKMKLINLDRTFPSGKYHKYLAAVEISDEQKLNVKHIEQIFIILRANFIKGSLDLDDFALICHSLFVVTTQKHFDDDNLVLANVLDGVNELSFDVRTDKEEIVKFIPNRVRLIFDYKPESEPPTHASAKSKNIYN